MSLFSLAFAYVVHRRMVSVLTVLSIALGLALVLIVLSVGADMQRSFLRQSQRIDLVVGAGGSETALVLAALFHAETPRANIGYRTYLEIARQPGVVAAIPLGLGDTYKGARIVGTTRGFFEDPASPFALAQGRFFESDFEIVAGSNAAQRLGLRLDSTVTSSHGSAIGAALHQGFPFKVVGILAPTGTAHDRALFTPIASYWKVHAAPAEALGSATKAVGQEPEVTVVLVRCQKPLVFELRGSLARKFGVMAVRPAEVLQRMFEQALHPFEKVLILYGYAVVAVSAASVLCTLYLSTLVRRRDIAVLRSLGARPSEVSALIFLEAGILLTIGCGLGVLLSRAAAMALRWDLESRFGLALDSLRFTPAEVLATAAVILLGMLAAILPAWQSYRSEIANQLR